MYLTSDLQRYNPDGEYKYVNVHTVDFETATSCATPITAIL